MKCLFLGISLCACQGLCNSISHVPLACLQNMKQIYPDILDLHMRGKVFLVLHVFSMTNIYVFSSPHFFSLTLTLRNNKMLLALKFKTWDLNSHRQYSLRGMWNIWQNFLKEWRAVVAWLKPCSNKKQVLSERACKNAFYVIKLKRQPKLDVYGITEACLWCLNFLRTY